MLTGRNGHVNNKGKHSFVGLKLDSVTFDILEGKHLLVEDVAEVFNVTRFGKIVKKTLLQPLQLVTEVLVKMLT